MITCIYYTDSNLPATLWRVCIGHLERALADVRDQQVIALGNRAMPELPATWTQRVVTGVHGLHDCYTKILAGLDMAENDDVYLLEHDVLYPPRYFDRRPDPGTFGYCQDVYRQNQHGFFPWWCNWNRRRLTSCCSAKREALRECFALRMRWLADGKRITVDEPGAMEDDAIAEYAPWNSPVPVVDIRWGGNLTGMRSAGHYLYSLPHWGAHDPLWRSYGLSA